MFPSYFCFQINICVSKLSFQVNYYRLWNEKITEIKLKLSYGIKKLQITCVIEDDKVMMDDLEDQIIGFEDYVQSMDIVAFNKI